MRMFMDRVQLRSFRHHSFAAGLAMIAVAALTFPATAQIATDDDGPTIQEGQQLIQQQNFEGAAKVFETITIREPDNGLAWQLLGYSRHGAGDLAQALPAHLMAAEFPAPIGPIGMYNAACVYSIWERPDRAFLWLNRSIAAGFSNRAQLVNDPDMDNIREDERFEKILARLSAPAPRPAPRSSDTADSATSGISALKPERQFDFWVGTWKVINANGDQVGTNVIEKQLGGHLIFEQWTSAQGGKGKSMNYYNPDEQSWTQIWVDGSGGIISKVGGFKDGAMRMEGKHILPNGEVRVIRSSLTPNEDGSVHQYIQESTDGGETWNDWFEGRYVRVEVADATKKSARRPFPIAVTDSGVKSTDQMRSAAGILFPAALFRSAVIR